MKSLTKTFLLLMWVVALAGAGWGWWQFTHSGISLASLINQARLMQGGDQSSETDWENTTVDFSDGTEAVNEPAEAATPQDLSCVKNMQQLAQATINQYLAENGQPKARVDLQKDYAKTPAELKKTFFDGVSCGAQYMYCDGNTCSYSVYAMQKQGNFNTIAVSIAGTLFAMNQNHLWHLSCFDMSEAGKQICAEYKNPPVTTTAAAPAPAVTPAM